MCFDFFSPSVPESHQKMFGVWAHTTVRRFFSCGSKLQRKPSCPLETCIELLWLPVTHQLSLLSCHKVTFWVLRVSLWWQESAYPANPSKAHKNNLYQKLCLRNLSLSLFWVRWPVSYSPRSSLDPLTLNVLPAVHSQPDPYSRGL